MEELLNNMIEEIKEIKNKKDLIEANKNELYRLKTNKEMYRNNDKSLKPQLKLVYENVTKQMSDLLKQNRELNKEIAVAKQKIIDTCVSEIETKKAKIENNKTELYRLKSNKEKLRNKDNSLKPELRQVYVDITQNMRKILKENRELNSDIALLENIQNTRFLEGKEENQKNETIISQNIDSQVESKASESRNINDKLESIQNEEDINKEIQEFYKQQEDTAKKKLEEALKKFDRANKKKQRDAEKFEKVYDDEARKEISEYENELDNKENEELNSAIESVKSIRAKNEKELNEKIDEFNLNKQIENDKRDVIINREAKRQIAEYEKELDEQEKEEYERSREAVIKLREQKAREISTRPIFLDVFENGEIEDVKNPLEQKNDEPETVAEPVNPLSLGDEEEAAPEVAPINPSIFGDEEAKPEVAPSTPLSLEDEEEQQNVEDNSDDNIDLNNVTLNPLTGEYQVDEDILNSRNKQDTETVQLIEQITMAIVEDGITINKQDAKELLKKAPKGTKQLLLDKINTGVRIDGNIALGLIDNEEQLSKYLEICEKYDDLSLIGPENEKTRTELAEYLPRIEYSLKNLRKSNIDMTRKLKIYENAKYTQRMYREYGRGKDAKIKMSIFDKIYFGIANLMKINQQVLTEGQNAEDNQNETESNYTELSEKIANSIIEQEKREQFTQRMTTQVLQEKQKQEKREQFAERIADEIEDEEKREEFASRMATRIENADNATQNNDVDNAR